MSLKQQFAVILTIPLLGMIIIFLLGLQSYSSIKDKTNGLMLIENDLATMLNGDRDAYQAFLAEKETADSLNLEDLKAFDDSNQENIQQTWDRVIGPSANFTPEMEGPLTRFKTKYQEWFAHSRKIIELSRETASENSRIQASSAAAIAAFGKMRDNIDILGEMIDKELEKDLAAGRRRDLEKALSLVLNGDRDAYQAYVAQIMAIRSLDKAAMEGYSKDAEENIAQTTERFQRAADIMGQTAASLKSQFSAHFSEWESQSLQAVQLARQTLDHNITKQEESVLSSAAFAEMRDAIDVLGEMQNQRAQQGQKQMIDSISLTTIIYIVTVILAMALALGIAFLLIRSILAAIKQCVGLAEKIGEGDFTDSLETKRKDEIGRLMIVMNQMATMLKNAISSINRTMNYVSEGDFTRSIDNQEMKGELVQIKTGINKSIDMLSDTIQEVVIATDQVNTGSEQFSSASQALAAGSAEQAASLEEIGSTMSEVGGHAKTNNKAAEKAVVLVNQTMETSKNGNDKMKDLLASMERINASSNEIAKIIKVIDDIAFQTNLLALNAAVEAARAGKYGKGFAIVAEEVRNLAARSAEAAKNTNELIENSVKEIETGYGNSQKTAEILEKINQGVSNVNDLLGEISVVSNEQNVNIAEINNALNQVNQVVQNNSSISEETASAAEELSGQSSQLQVLMARFTLPNLDKPTLDKPKPNKTDKPLTDMLREAEKLPQPEPVKELPLTQKPAQKTITLDDTNFGKY